MSWWQALLLGLLPAAAWAWWSARRLRRALHILQLEEYENSRALRWSRKYWLRDYAALFLALGTLGVAVLAAVVLANSLTGSIALAVVVAGTGLAAPLLAKEHRPKKALVFTARVKRLLIALAAVLASVMALLVLIGWAAGAPARGAFLAASTTAWIAVALSPLLVAAANLVALPVEELNKRRYRREAERRLRTVSPRIVAITGSYGKTTTKELIAAILETRYRVLKTPASFNTVMGITRVIREDLRDDHEVFVVEMGAYHPGNIRELCRFVGGPDVSVLVGINEQHLERFGSIENTIRTKYEIVEETKPDGVAIFNVDNPHCAELAARTQRVRVLRVGATEHAPMPDLYADAVTIAPKLMRFEVHDGETQLTVRTRLVGRHLLPNILIALAVGKELGIDLRTAVARLGRVEPVAHRLVVSEVDGKLVIDDAYSSNVDGAMAALDLLAELPAQRRLLVTPGIVELGTVEVDRNREFGARAATICDVLLVVGAAPGRFVREGALAAGLPAAQLLACTSLADAQDYLRAHAREGDAVLFENDLPDNYA